MTRPGPLLIGCLLGLGAVDAQAAQVAMCIPSATPLVFGKYNQQDPKPARITATVTVTCTATISGRISYTIEVGPGSSGTFARRSLHSGTAQLSYQLYTTANMAQIWGDGTGVTGTVTDSYTLQAGTSRTISYRVYGVIIPRQPAVSGQYTDPLTVTLKN